ncbi:unnamed protein product [Staurois parvus]|uniref:Uncharacterized protein n=1 Tax=Staurois parvus TaxID=386267 RepID=A0ABN9BX48_9NEOB|nr:unnamed protein product [Staurois parvus]CAI9608156.1 unnamed protein product [Staurois parvus]
MSIQRMLL